MSPADAVRVRDMIDARRRGASPLGATVLTSTPTRCCCSPWSAQWRGLALWGRALLSHRAFDKLIRRMLLA